MYKAEVCCNLILTVFVLFIMDVSDQLIIQPLKSIVIDYLVQQGQITELKLKKL